MSATSFFEWVRRQWNDIKGNVKYGILLAMMFLVGIITRGLTWWQQASLGLLFVLAIGWAIAAMIKSDKLSAQIQSRLSDAPANTAPKQQLQAYPSEQDFLISVMSLEHG